MAGNSRRGLKMANNLWRTPAMAAGGRFLQASAYGVGF